MQTTISRRTRIAVLSSLVIAAAGTAIANRAKYDERRSRSVRYRTYGRSWEREMIDFANNCRHHRFMNAQNIFIRCVPVLATTLLLFAGTAAAQDPGKLVTKADVEKVTGAKFGDGTKPMPEQVMFQQAGGNLQISVDVEKAEAGKTVRTWEATMKKMRPTFKVDTVPSVGKDAVFYSMRADSGAVSADFDKPRMQLRVSVAGAKDEAQAKQIVVDLAKIIGSRVK